jgi:hypothetical protein
MLEDYDVGEEKLNQMIKNLKSRGVIFEPNAGKLKKV